MNKDEFGDYLLDLIQQAKEGRGEMFHGYAVATCDGALDEDCVFTIDEGDEFPITAWLPEDDVTCIIINGTMFRMEVDFFKRFFRRRTGI